MDKGQFLDLFLVDSYQFVCFFIYLANSTRNVGLELMTEIKSCMPYRLSQPSAPVANFQSSHLSWRICFLVSLNIYTGVSSWVRQELPRPNRPTVIWNCQYLCVVDSIVRSFLPSCYGTIEVRSLSLEVHMHKTLIFKIEVHMYQFHVTSLGLFLDNYKCYLQFVRGCKSEKIHYVIQRQHDRYLRNSQNYRIKKNCPGAI